MPPKGPSIVPKQAPSPIAIAGSPPSSSGSTPRSIASPITSLSTSVSMMPKQQLTSIQTSKEWVLPPRPKPGRKPSVDTPASKRKAQNRAAQRAFRERRATRVQELEQRLLEVEKERDIKEMALVNTINKLKVENQFLVKNMEQLRQELAQIKSSSSSIRMHSSKPSPQPIPQQQGIKSSYTFGSNTSNHPSPAHHNSISPTGSSYSVQQISPAPSADSPPVSYNNNSSVRLRQSHSHPTPTSSNNTPDKAVTAADVANFDCGVCPKEECLCESVGLKAPSDNKNQQKLEKQLNDQINSIKPMSAVTLKRKRTVKSIEDEQEIDFTKQFTTKSKPMPDLKKLKKSVPQTTVTNSFNEDSPVDNCGFCSDDTPCVCREAAKEAAKLSDFLNNQQSTIIEEQDDDDDVNMSDDNKILPPLKTNNSNHNFHKASLPVMHPGPTVEIREFTNISAVPSVIASSSESSSTNATSSSKESSTDGGCTGNPGTCRQCQTDPMSTLFCTTVASRSSLQVETTSSVRELSRSNSKTSVIPVNSLNNPQSPVPPPLLASAAPSPAPSGSGTPSNNGMFIPCADAYKTLSRHKKFNSVDFSTLVGKLTTRGMQVEVQSVANVLRELDRRLYN